MHAFVARLYRKFEYFEQFLEKAVNAFQNKELFPLNPMRFNGIELRALEVHFLKTLVALNVRETIVN